jgi:hypothetical protein
MMSFLMQNKLGELSNERYLDTLSEQDRLMRERSAQEDVMARGRAKENYGMDFNLAIQKGIISAINDPALDGLRRQAQLYDMAGDTERAKQAKEAFASKVPGYINAAYVANTGKRPLSEAEIMDALMATDTDSLMTLIKEGGVNRRFEQELPIQKQQAATSAGNLALGQKQFEAEQGPGGTTATTKATDYYKNMHTKIGSVQRYLASMKDYVESGGDISQEVDWEKLLAGPTTPKLLGQALSKLSTYDTKAMKRPLTPEEEAWIDRAWDIVNLQEEEKSGGIGSTAYPAGAKQKLEADVNASLGADATPTAPARSIHPVGEKKTVVINGVNATYIWDGTKWLLSDSK